MNESGTAGPRWWTIFRKEFREIFRDRRTILSVVVGPLLVTPGLLAIVGISVRGRIEQTRTQTYAIGLANTGAEGPLIQALKRARNLRVVPVEPRGAEAAIRSRRVNAVILLPPDVQGRLDAGQPVSVQVVQDAGNETSVAASARVSRFFDQVGQRMLEQRLKAHGLPPGIAQPFEVSDMPIRSGGGAGMLILGQLLPYVLVLAAFSGAIYASFDQVAGEKERGTLETLLVSPASRRDIVLGKFGAVVGVCMVSGILSIVGLAIPFFSGLRAFAWLSRGEIHMSGAAVAAIVIVILPVSVLFAGVLLAVSTFARNQKEAQTYLGTLFPVILVPTLFSIFIGPNPALSVALVPILNASLIIKQALSGSYDAGFIGVAFVASAVYAGLALLIATRLFQKEGVLIKA